MEKHIRLEHGSGGALSRELVEEVIYPRLKNVSYPALNDATPIACSANMCMTTDTYVIDPVFFPGGDIGELAVYGTCNDLAVSGATPRFLSLGFVLEEGFPVEDLERILISLAAAAELAGVAVVTGDTKVVPRGKGGGIYINSAGVGEREFSGDLGSDGIQSGDVIVVSAPVGAHGIAVMAAREGLPVGASLQSDCTSLYPLCRSLFGLGPGLRVMRDATRGGLSAVLNELISGLDVGMRVIERSIPVDGDVAAAAGILGLNPLEVANEGVFVFVVSADVAEKAVKLLQGIPGGEKAVAVGAVVEERPGTVVLQTAIGGTRLLDVPRGLLLPRIC